LAFVGEQSNNHVLTRCHRLVERHAALFSAGDRTDTTAVTGLCLSSDAIDALESIGLRPERGLLRDVPDWLVSYVAAVALFMRVELRRLPRDILCEHRLSTAREVKKSKGAWKPPPFGLGDAEIEALSVRENRAQSVAICLSKVRYLLGRGAEKAPRKKAPPPFRRLRDDDAETRALFFGARRDALARVLLQCMAPHARHGDAAVAHAAFAEELETIAAKVCGSALNDGAVAEGDEDEDASLAEERKKKSAEPLQVPPSMSLRDGLLWLRDRLAAMPVTPGARHDIAADLVHVIAHTNRRYRASVSESHAALRGDPIPVRENEVNSYGIGAEGATGEDRQEDGRHVQAPRRDVRVADVVQTRRERPRAVRQLQQTRMRDAARTCVARTRRDRRCRFSAPAERNDARGSNCCAKTRSSLGLWRPVRGACRTRSDC
jgi:hypothetical protein